MVSRQLFPDWQWRLQGFKLLGAPLGEAAFCTAHSTKRDEKAEALLKEISKYSHTQGALQLLRRP